MIKLQELQLQLCEFAKSHDVKLWFEVNHSFKIVHVIARKEPKNKTLYMRFTIDLINEHPNVFETLVRNMIMNISDAPRAYGMISTNMFIDEWGAAKVNEDFNDALMQIKNDILEEEEEK